MGAELFRVYPRLTARVVQKVAFCLLFLMETLMQIWNSPIGGSPWGKALWRQLRVLPQAVQ